MFIVQQNFIMNLNRYQYFTSNDLLDYFFYSEGPNGKIKKNVSYSKMSEDPVVYNLSFDDEDQYTGKISETTVSNNQDRGIILSTVAATIITFCEHYGDHFHATGSTASRTRPYQIEIAVQWNEIKKDFDVYGFKEGNRQEFSKECQLRGVLG